MSQKKFLFYLIFIILMSLIFLLVRRNIYSVQFGDEEDNFITGQWLLTGKKLYQDIFFLHQPSLSVLSAFLQKIFLPHDIFSLVRLHRIFIFIYSFIWLFLLISQFGLAALIFALVFEPSKFFLLGNSYLAETAVVYPIIFIITILFNGFVRKIQISNWQISLLIFSLIFIQLTLLPMLPFTILSVILLGNIIHRDKRIFSLKISLLSISLTILVLLPFISFPGYLQNTIITNITDFIPQETTYSLTTATARIFFLPFLSFSYPSQSFFLILKIISLFYILSIFLILLFNGKHFLKILILYILLASTNCRPVPVGSFRSGFHLLPFYASIIWLTILQFRIFFLKKNRLFFSLILCVILIIFYNSSYQNFFLRSNPEADLNINYSNFFIYGEVVKLLSVKNDTLLTIPAGPLIYWQSQLPPNSRFFYVLGFMRVSPKIKKELIKNFANNPPVFLYVENSLDNDDTLSGFLVDYRQIKKDGKPSLLFVRIDKVQSIPKSSWMKVKKYGFEPIFY